MRRLPKTVTEEQFADILRQASRRAPTGLRNRALLLVLWDAGLRVSEACALAPGDVDRDALVIRVRHGKGDADREVPLTDAAVTAIEKWTDRRGRGGAWLFDTLDRGRLSDRYVRAMLARYSVRAGVFKTVTENGVNISRPVNPHMLRHSYATRLLRRGIAQLDEVQELLGHASIATTRVYLHVDDIELREKVRTGLGGPAAAPDLEQLIRELIARHASPPHRQLT